MERLIKMCQTIWNAFTEEERENYSGEGAGTYDFIESVADLIFFDVSELSEDDLDKICDAF
jgi:hypothetical protein